MDCLCCRCRFLEDKHNKAISKDTWVQLLDFVRVRLFKLRLMTEQPCGCAFWPSALAARNAQHCCVFPICDKQASVLSLSQPVATDVRISGCWADTAVLLRLQAVKPDLSNFEDSGTAWPYLLDDFVDWAREGHLMDTS